MFIRALEWFQDKVGLVDAITLGLCIFVFLPMIFSKRTRGWGAVGFVYSSYGWGLYLWLTAFLYTYGNFGLFWLMVGLVFAGIGIVPIAAIGSLIHADWSGLLQLFAMLVFSIGFRFFGLYMAAKHEESLHTPEMLSFAESPTKD